MKKTDVHVLKLCFFVWLFVGKKSSSSEDEEFASNLVNTGIGELPPGAQLSDSDDMETTDANDPHRALNIDLDLPLREDERLPVLEHKSHLDDVKGEKNSDKSAKSKKVTIFCSTWTNI